MKFDDGLRLTDLLGITFPIIQAPMVGAAFSEMVVGVSEAGGLGSLACAMLTAPQIREEVALIRKRTSRPINLNFFCHRLPASDARREANWKTRLEPYYREMEIDPLQASAPRAAVRLTPLLARSLRRSLPKSSAFILDFRTRRCSRVSGLPGVALFPRRQPSGRRGGSKSADAMRLLHKDMRLGGIAVCFWKRKLLPRSARWPWSHKSSMP
jgi:hypothetical protein